LKISSTFEVESAIYRSSVMLASPLALVVEHAPQLHFGIGQISLWEQIWPHFKKKPMP
jgi:hypothetical protein